MRLLGMFAKHWTPGRVKTRLAAAIGNEAAAELHRLCVEVLAQRFGGVADTRWLAVSPAESMNEIHGVAGSQWMVREQSLGDLGQRMENFFHAAFAAGAERVALIGSDSPTLPEAYVEQAFAKLDTHDVVLGKAADGGYYLVGAKHCAPPIFAEIDWGTPRVWDQTVAALERCGRNWQALPTWYDVDVQEDFARLRQEVEQLREVDARWNPLWNFLGRLPPCVNSP